ncbi:MAG: transcription termination/antitermination protein NusG [Phycisphaerae bacterium]|nr:transcription termination/antitermination protein NusG [Phycisphaerae bacterium]
MSGHMAKQWYVLRVASNREEQVRQAIERKVRIEGLEDKVGRVLVPMDRRPRPPTRGKGGEKKFVERKLYPGYVFIEMELEDNGTIGEAAWFLIKETTGVGDFIGSASKPIAMSDADAGKMLMQVDRPDEDSAMTVEFAKGEMVKIREGAFENFDGVVDEVLADKGLIRVIVTIFGRATPVELEYWQVEKE